MVSKAVVIELANHLRRNAEQLRRLNAGAYAADVIETRNRLFEHGIVGAELDALLPDVVPHGVPCRLQPLADHVVLRPAAAKEKTEAGLVIPDSAKEVPMQGEVLAVGPGRVEPGVGTIVPAVKVGDTVLFGRYAGVEVQLDGEDVRIMREEDILGILAPETA